MSDRKSGSSAARAALITGASSGIGYELARLFAQDDYRLVLVARNRERLEEIARDFSSRFGVTSIVLAQDLADPAAPKRIFAELQQRSVEVDALVNNAGFGSFGPFAEADLAADLRMVQVNVTSLTHLTGLLVRPMLARGAGRIMNVASTAAFQAGPLMAVYYATKAYVLLFSEAIANELEGSGVTVTCLCPGPTRTEFHLRAQMADSKLFRWGMMEAAQVARAGYRAMMAGKTLVIPGFKNQAGAWLTRLGPRSLVTNIARRAQERV